MSTDDRSHTPQQQQQQKQCDTNDDSNVDLDLDALIIEPAREHLGTVVALHGMGGTGHSFRKLLEPVLMSKGFVRDHLRWIFPSARSIHIDIAQGSMAAWYNIHGVKLFAPEDRKGIDQSAHCIHRFIEREIANGVPSERIIVCGVSQGGATALYSTLTFRGGRLGGCICVYGWIPLARAFLTSPSLCSQSRKTPIMFCHGKRDTSVRHAFGVASCRFVQIALRWGRNAKFMSYAELDHYTTNDKQMEDIVQFLSQTLQPGERSNGNSRNSRKRRKNEEKAAAKINDDAFTASTESS